jgi:hypothetical protein
MPRQATRVRDQVWSLFCWRYSPPPGSPVFTERRNALPMASESSGWMMPAMAWAVSTLVPPLAPIGRETSASMS